ncbi:hypothetical protein PoB_003325700 [Plakobranchus ocellatus]|uniref:Uncharacterized protein n=1 Tax=Plakobranchus ocellatus TaxID=259542 RepID=A0AAV4AIA2_9GAST|nr:hypothetical protein PoB_003325700 [Plakobranchus ocellatus]
MEPCGTPRRICEALEMLLLKDTDCTLSDKKDWRSIVNMIRVSSSDESMIGCDVFCCDVVLWPMEGGVLAFGTARADKSCAACRVPSMEGPP